MGQPRKRDWKFPTATVCRPVPFIGGEVLGFRGVISRNRRSRQRGFGGSAGGHPELPATGGGVVRRARRRLGAAQAQGEKSKGRRDPGSGVSAIC